MTVFVFGKNNTHIQHHLGQANFVVPLTPNIQLRMQELKASTAMPCVLAMIAIVAAFSGLILSTSPTSAQQVSGRGGAGGQHAISPPRAGGSGAAATSYSGGGGGGGGGKNATAASGGIGGHGGSGPHARGGGVGGSYNSPGHDGTKGADGVGKGWIWAPGNFGHDGGSGGGGGGGGSPSPLPSGLVHNISNSMVGGVGGTGGNGAVGGIGYSAAYFLFSSYWDGTGGGGGAGGGGGGGGAGLYFTSSTQGYLPADQVAANISANITGGTGGDGGYGGDGGAGETKASKNYAVGGDGGSGGNGGNGGAGILAGGYIASLYLTAGTAVSGGSGGKGGNGGWGGNSDYASNYNLGNGGNGGNGGVGGTGIVLGGLNADHSHIILGEGASVKGGQGGDRGFRGDHGSVQEGTMSPSNGKPGLAGKGGQGIWLNSGADLRIDVGKGAVIQGGDGSIGGIGIEGSASQSIVGVAGTVSGGLGSDGTRANAVSINGTDNVLQLRNGYQLVGEVNLGTDVMLSLAGSENATFDLTTIGTQYLGLSRLLKQDGSTWTLNGKSSSRFADVSVSAGRLVLGNQSDLLSDIGFIDGGEVAVNGNGTADSAKWTVDQSLLVGNINTGSLEISDGGTVKVGKDLLIGENNSVSGMVNITSSQSKLTVGGMLAVGDSGQGTMTVSDGAQVQSGKVAIGRNSGSIGSVVVTGTGTKWTAQEIFVSGGNVDNDGGHGSLTISDGATIGAPRGFIDVGDHGAYGVVNIGAAEGENAVAPGFFVGSDLLLAPFTDAVFNHNATDYSFDASISGFANLKFLSGTTKLTGDSSLFNGNATITNSTLNMAERAKLGGTLTVSDAGRLEGSGQVGTTIINAGGTLAPSGTRSMTINGDLTLNSGGAFLPSDTASLIVNGNATFNSGAAYNYNLAVGGIATSATTVVNGNVALNGTTLNISGEPAIGYHRLISYTGSLTQENGGLNVGSTPDTTPFGYNYAIDTSVSRSVDLLVSPQGLNILQLWDGGIPGGNNQDGTWNTASQNWSDPIGGTADTTWGHGYAIFRGFGGLVTIEGAQSAVGLQFAGGNYRIDGSSGATLNLVGYSGPGLEIDVPEIRVLNNEGAVISADITGTSGLEKTGDGLLVLWGNNTYSGNTYVSGGILQIASMQNLGASSNTLIIDNAMLRTANSFDMTQAITLGGVSTINVLLGEEMKLSGGVTGDGMLFKDGGGTLLLSGTNSWSGGTWINDGTLRIEEGNYSAIAYNSDYVITGGLLDLNGMDLRMRSLIGSDGEISINASTLTIAQDTDTIFAGRITGNNFDSNLIKTGSGMLVLTGNSSYYGSTTIYGGSLAISDARNIGLNSGSSRLEINNNTALITLADIELNRQVTLVGNATINTIFGTTLELSGPVTGSLGTLYKDGAGRLIISGNGTYGQGTVIAGGILQIGDGGTTGSLTGNIANNSLLTFDRSNTYTYNGVISGEGAVLQAGSGTTILTGDHSYTGNTFITSGTLQVGNGGETGSIGGYVLNDGTLAFNRSDDYTFSGLIIGTGALVQAGSGTLILDADNYYTSGTSIESGTLQIGSGGKSGWITGDVANDGTLAFNRSDAFEFAGKISGTGGFQQKGEGAVILTGDSSYTGATDVLAGRLAVNGSIDSSILTTVYEGAELGGNGTVGQTFVNGGTLAPGNSIGTLNVAGDLQLTASSTYQVEVSPTNSDKVNVSGQADLGGATVQAMFDPGAYIMKRYNILSADGGFSGTTFGEEVTTDLPENFASLLRYDANNVYLDLEMSIGGLNVNQQNVSTALVNYFDENGQIPVAFGALDADGLSAVSGELATAAQQTTVDAMSQFMNTLADPLVTGRAGRITTSQTTDASAFENRWSVWGAGYGSARSTDGNATIGSHDTRGRVYGVAVGADYLVSPDTIIGFAVAGGGTKFSLADGMGSGDSDLFQAGIYGRHNIGNAYITGALAYGWQSIDTERTVSFYEADQLTGSYRANSWSGRLEAGYRFETPWLGITPYAAGQFVSFDLPSYSEKAYAGSDTYALSYSSQKETVGRSELGLSLDKSIALSDGVFTARGRLAWARNFNNERNVFAAINALPGAGFVVNGASQPKDVGLASISAEMSWTNGLSLGAAFDAEFSGASANYAGKGLLRYKW